MREIVKINNKDKYSEYEELIFKKQEVTKKAFHLNKKYIYTYGDLINDLYKKQIEVIKLKKMINYCVMQNNMSKLIFSDELNDYVKNEMKEHYMVLEGLISEKNQVDKDFSKSVLSNETLKEIKKIYHKIAKMIHPDLHPDLIGNEDINVLWENVCVYYECNDLKSLEECLDTIYLYFSSCDSSEVYIENIDDKIIKIKSEIEEIMTNAPYIYEQYLLDPIIIANKRKELQIEIDSYTEYIKVLENTINKFVIVDKVV